MSGRYELRIDDGGQNSGGGNGTNERCCWYPPSGFHGTVGIEEGFCSDGASTIIGVRGTVLDDGKDCNAAVVVATDDVGIVLDRFGIDDSKFFAKVASGSLDLEESSDPTIVSCRFGINDCDDFGCLASGLDVS